MTPNEISYYSNIHYHATKDFEQIRYECEQLIACMPYQWSMDYMLSLNCVGIFLFDYKTDINEAKSIQTRLEQLKLNYEYIFIANEGGISVEFKTKQLGTYVG